MSRPPIRLGTEPKLLPTRYRNLCEVQSFHVHRSKEFPFLAYCCFKTTHKSKKYQRQPSLPPSKTDSVYTYTETKTEHTRARLILGRKHHSGGAAGPAPQFTPPTRSLSPAPRLVSLLPPRAPASPSPVWAGRFRLGGLFLTPEPGN